MPKKIASRIVERRKELGITQGKLAEIIGVNHSTLSRYETGEINMSKVPYPQIIKMANALRCTPESLYGEEEFATNADNEKELIYHYYRLSEPKRKAILTIARAMV